MASNLDRKDVTVQEIEGHPPQQNVETTKATWDTDDIHQAALADNPDRAKLPTFTTLLAILSIGLSIVAPLGCGFIVATSILYNIGVELGDTVNILWVVSGWSIASSVSFSLAGSLSDIFGRRYVLLAGEVFSLIGSIVAATARNLATLIGASTILGFACGFVLVAYAAVPELLPNRWRPVGIAFIDGFIPIPWIPLSFLLGNLLYIHASWRWVYYICIIYATLSLVGTATFYFPQPAAPTTVTSSRFKRFISLDFIGITLYTGGLTSILLGLSWGGNSGHPWHSATVIVPIVAGACGFVSSFVYDFKLRRTDVDHVLFPRNLFLQFREFTVSLVVVFPSAMVYYTMSALLPQATQLVYGAKPIEVGLLLLPNGLGQFCGTAILPLLITWTGHPKRYLVAGVFTQTLFTGLYAYAIGGHKATWSAFQFFGAGPFGLIVITTVLNASLHVRPSELGLAVGVLGTFRSMGGSVGNAIYSSILKSVIEKELPKRIIASAIHNGYAGDLKILIEATIATVNGVPGAFKQVKGMTMVIETGSILAARQAYAQAFRMVFYSTIPFGVIAVAAALWVKDSTKYMTNHTHVQLTRDVVGRSAEKTDG